MIWMKSYISVKDFRKIMEEIYGIRIEAKMIWRKKNLGWYVRNKTQKNGSLIYQSNIYLVV
jgi:hypothetical protein